MVAAKSACASLDRGRGLQNPEVGDPRGNLGGDRLGSGVRLWAVFERGRSVGGQQFLPSCLSVESWAPLEQCNSSGRSRASIA